ncbi:hypothetical protein ACOTF2_07005 [Achromobacter xylosoxidans]
MSKRYGRNQRRRARERIAQLELSNGMGQGLLEHAHRRLAEAEAVIDHARSVLGHDVALPPLMRGDHPMPLGGDFRIADPNFRMPAYWSGSQSVPVTMEMKILQMRELVAFIERQDLSRAVHFYVQLDDGQAAYAIDERAFTSMPRDHLEATLRGPISQALAHHLADFLKSR